MNDTQFADENVVDTAYDDIFGTTRDDDEIPEAEGDLEPVPAFRKYHLACEGASAKIAQTGTPMVDVTFRVVNGPKGTIGRLIRDSIYFNPPKPTKKDKEGNEVDKTPEEIEKQKKRFVDELKRIQFVLDFAQRYPASLDEIGLNQYAAQFATAPEFICRLRVEPARGDFPAKNRIVWMSLRKPSEPPSKEDSPFGTAMEECLDAIEKFDAKASQRNTGRTAAGMKSAASQGFM